MKTVNVHKAKTTLSAVLKDVELHGEIYLICRHGKPVADLVPHEARSRTTPHPVMKRIRVKYDPTEPLDSEDWPEEE